jgi:hypothetical protein
VRKGSAKGTVVESFLNVSLVRGEHEGTGGDEAYFRSGFAGKKCHAAKTCSPAMKPEHMSEDDLMREISDARNKDDNRQWIVETGQTLLAAVLCGIITMALFWLFYQSA